MASLHRTKIQFNPFKDSTIENAIAELKKAKDEINRKNELLVKTLAENGVEIAVGKVRTYNAIFTSELINGIRAEKREDNVYVIISDSKHSAFVEFGTGQLGSVKPYKYDLPSGVTWNYNVGEYVQYAEEDLTWGDRKIPAGTYYWFYWKNGKWWLTQGMPSRPYMTETALALDKKISKVAKEIFNA